MTGTPAFVAVAQGMGPRLPGSESQWGLPSRVPQYYSK